MSTREALAELVACVEVSVPYIALTKPGYRWHDAMNAARAALAEKPAPTSAWVPVKDRLPGSGVTVLAVYTNRAGKVRRIRADWVAAKTIESGADSEIGEYDEATDCYYEPEGWYEKIDNWAEYTSVGVVEGEVTHWAPMPAFPQKGTQDTE